MTILCSWCRLNLTKLNYVVCVNNLMRKEDFVLCFPDMIWLYTSFAPKWYLVFTVPLNLTSLNLLSNEHTLSSFFFTAILSSFCPLYLLQAQYFSCKFSLLFSVCSHLITHNFLLFLVSLAAWWCVIVLTISHIESNYAQCYSKWVSISCCAMLILC